MKITYELTIDGNQLAEGNTCVDTAAELMEFMAKLLRREGLGGPVVSKVDYGAGIPTGHTIVCTAVDHGA